MANVKPRDTSTIFPDSPLSLPMPQLSVEQRAQLGISCKQFIDINMGTRKTLNDDLDLWLAMYEMRTAPRDTPWPNAPNICIPVITPAINEVVSRVTGTVYQQPRRFTVRGNDPVSSQYAHISEQFYNAENARNEWDDVSKTCVHLSARDGTGICATFWELSVREEIRYETVQAETEDGLGAADENGQPIMRKVPKKVQIVDYDAPRDSVVELRDFYLIPNHAPSIDKADAVARRVYMSEPDLQKMVNAKVFDEAAVEAALAYNGPGQGEVSKETQNPAPAYSAGGKIDVVDSSVAPPSGIYMSRGPLEVWQYHTRQFDLDGDGQLEENIVWIHSTSRIVLGFAPYEYYQGRPYHDLTLFPRPNRFYGYSIAEWGRGIQEETNSVHNGRLEWMDLSTQPMRYATRGVRFRDEDRRFGPDVEIQVEKPDDFGFISMPDAPSSLTQEEQMLGMYMDRLTGAPQAAGAPQPGGANNQRSARAAQMQAAIMGAQSNMVITRVRQWELRKFKFKVGLYQQYGKDQLETVDQTSNGAKKFTVPKEILGLDYTYGIAGMGGPLDKEAQRQDMMMLAQVFQMPLFAPLIQGNLARVWTMLRGILETFDIPEVTTYIGTMQEAQEQQQAMQQAQQQAQQQQMMMAMLEHGHFTPKKGASGGGPPAQ